ncbi:hypothetical protein IWT25_02169 [Secundilactobacillus pentosiphilus]|uniref:IrrE N-terminal-like domain-containing protein n=1 Tax=Secundilactobacillus pentosiphilus TaxID=1714682 RepID=A0A1Z5IZ33_9LACO|nr:ImmA/IrrE family metallo-endopeptidase [Secundilactobacillus pentosiphilus]GAX06822.1 hypothetical protein IWT25_02169 [Secundilactobacillus pentosiphilus]
MKLPKQVKVSGIIYSVIEKKHPEDEGHTVWGFTDYEVSKIFIRKGLSEQKKRQTLMHELVHAMLHEAGEDEHCNDESIVNPLGNMLDQVLQDNPELINK